MAKLTYEGALQQQKEAKAAVKAAKTALTEYYKANKLKRNEDYSNDKKHGKKIASLEKEIKKCSATLANINEKVEALKDGGKTKKASGTGAKRQKYDYPADCDTPAKKKKYRQMMRDLKAGKVKKEKKAKAEEETKTSKKAKAKVENPEKATKKTKVAKRSADKKAEKKSSKKAKPEDD